MQFDSTHLVPTDHKDLKSRHALTNLLNEQIDRNEDLSSENELLASQQRRLILLLSQKDSQISKYRNQIAAPDLTTRSLNSRYIQLQLLSHLIKRIVTRSLASSFENLKFSRSTGPSVTDGTVVLRRLGEQLFFASKSRLLKSLLSSAFYFRGQLANKGANLSSLMVGLTNKRLHQGLGSIREYIVKKKYAQENRNEVLYRVLDKVISRIKREALFRIRIKPYEEISSRVFQVTITSKKFLGLHLLAFHLSKIKGMVMLGTWEKLRHAGLREEAKIGGMFNAIERRLGQGQAERNAFLSLKLYGYMKRMEEMKESEKARSLERILNRYVRGGLSWAFGNLKGGNISKKKIDVPDFALKGKKKEVIREKERVRKENLDEWDRQYDNTWRKRRRCEPWRKRMPVKAAYKILKRSFVETKNQHAVQLANCMGMMGAKLMNFQQLNEQIIRESKETLKKSQELEERLEMKTKKEKELTHKLEELMRATQQIAEQKTSMAVEMSQLARQLSAAEEKVKGYEKKCGRLTEINEELSGDKNQLIGKVQELLETLEEMQNEYKKNQQEIKSLNMTNNTLKENLQDKTQEVVRLKEKYADIEEEFNQIRKLSEKKLSASQGEKMSGELKELKNQISKLRKEKSTLNEKYEETVTHNNRLKTSNSELTKEAILLNEERNSLKTQVTALKDTNSSLRRDMTILDNKLQKAMHELEEKKGQLMQKIMNEKATPDYVNQVLDEKKNVENENRALKHQIDKLHKKMNMYDNNTVKQTDDLIRLQKESQALKDERLALRNEIKDLNESLANLNRDKVNLMREMTLINDKNVKLEKEAESYRKAIEELEQEIQNYQLQLDMYVQVLKTMEDKMSRLDSKTKLTMSINSNTMASPSGYYPTQSSTKRDHTDHDDDEELINRLKTIKSKVK